MADLYSLVKKQDEKIDDLLKTAKENKDLLTDIDTRLASEPVQTEPSASAIPEKIQVELPANIATNESAKRLNDRMYSIVNGAIWAAIPKWVYAVAGALLLIAVGLGIGCFHLYKDNESLRNTEWLYRYERLWWEGMQQEDLLRREKTFAVGTQQEQDSIKNLTRQLEKSRHIEETFLYFNPTEK